MKTALVPIVVALVLAFKATSANFCASTPSVLTNRTGFFSSPNYPNNYPENTVKTWKIEAPVGHVVDLYFATFALERSTTCVHDYVKIRTKCDAVPMATYCAYAAKPLRSISNVLWVEFRSDESNNDKGFEALYDIRDTNTSKLLSCPRPSDNQSNIDYCLTGEQVQCCNNDDSNCRVDEILTANNGTLTSPGYPGKYPYGMRRSWRITVPEGYVVQINFTTLVTYHTSSCSDPGSVCNCDFVHVLDGPCPLYNSGTIWCGDWTWKSKLQSFITTGRHMVVIFRSDLMNNDIGFVAYYRRALNCEGDTPISCLNNGNASCCRRYASVCVSGTSTRSHCPRDGDPSSYIGCCTVNGSPSCCPVIEDNHNKVCPRPSDNIAYINVCSNGGKPVCCNRNVLRCRYNKLLSEPSGTITSPRYPSNYPTNAFFTWRITVPEGFLVQLNFTTMRIEDRHGCPYCSCDFVGVIDGPCFNVRGYNWCGTKTHPMPSFISTGRYLTVFFQSDATGTDEGFVAEYRRALKCGGATPYSCLNNTRPACCKTQGASNLIYITTFWINTVMAMSVLILV